MRLQPGQKPLPLLRLRFGRFGAGLAAAYRTAEVPIEDPAAAGTERHYLCAPRFFAACGPSDPHRSGR